VRDLGQVLLSSSLDNFNIGTSELFFQYCSILCLLPPKVLISRVRGCSELLDGCRSLAAIASVNSPSAFDQLLKPVSR